MIYQIALAQSQITSFTPAVGTEDYTYAFDTDTSNVGSFTIANDAEGEFIMGPGYSLPSAYKYVSCRIRLVWDSYPPTDGRSKSLSAWMSGTTIMYTDAIVMGDSGYYEEILAIDPNDIHTVANSVEFHFQANAVGSLVDATYSIRGFWLEVEYIPTVTTPKIPVTDYNPATTTPSQVYLPGHFDPTTGADPGANSSATIFGTSQAPDLSTGLSVGIPFYRGYTTPVTARRPTSFDGDYVPTNAAYAYDTTANSVDLTTTAELTTPSGDYGYFYVFYRWSGSTSISGTVRVSVLSVTTEHSEDDRSPDGYTHADSGVDLRLSIDGGTTWMSFDQTCSWGYGETLTTPVVLTKAISGVLPTNLVLRIRHLTGYATDNMAIAIALASWQISDIVVY